MHDVGFMWPANLSDERVLRRQEIRLQDAEHMKAEMKEYWKNFKPSSTHHNTSFRALFVQKAAKDIHLMF